MFCSGYGWTVKMACRAEVTHASALKREPEAWTIDLRAEAYSEQHGADRCNERHRHSIGNSPADAA